MELKYYVSIIRRRWVPVVAVPLLVAILVVLQAIGSDPSYTASSRLTVTRAPEQVDIEDFRYNDYYLFLSSEFLVDDLVEVVQGNVFAQDVGERVQEEFGVQMDPGMIQESLESDRSHRILSVDVSHEDEDHALMIAQAATRQLSENATEYFGFEGEDREALIEPIQFPENAAQDVTQDQIFWVLQIMVALFGGLLIAVFLEYVDDRIYSAEMAERSLDMDVLGEVPRGRVI
ncbi:MAG: hypothetical protein WD401_01915 [Thermomicrobiaceae bacterium]